MGQGRAQLYNLISILFLVLSIAVIVLVSARMAAPPPAPTQIALAVPTSAILPSPTLTFTYTPTYTSTFTETPSPTITTTITPSVTWTIIPSLTASETLTLAPTSTETLPPTVGPTPTDTLPPTAGPSPTFTPSLTITNTLVVTPSEIAPTASGFTAQPTQPPPSPFLFELRDEQVIYTSNFANTAGCAWQGVGGQVFDANNQPLLQVRVHVFGTGIDVFTTSGSNTLYGLSGWEVPLGTALTSNSYTVELQSEQGTIISPQVSLFFTPDCSKNLALVSFQQIRSS
ncbi:MAG: hypothetical protein U0521_00015 [Anaerolineae bacterium]